MTAGLPDWRINQQHEAPAFCPGVFLSQFFGNRNFMTAVFALIAFLLCFSCSVFANDVRVENVEVVETDTTEKTAQIEFDLSWENSWKDSVNNDAVWLFFKYSTDSGNTWVHGTMDRSGTNPSGFSNGTAQSGSKFTSNEMIVSPDKKGVFIQPAHLGSGKMDFHNMQLVWDYGADGVNDPYSSFSSLSSNVRVRLFAIEMTYIPQGGFYAGDGNDGSVGQFEFGGASASKPGAISSEAGLSFGTGTTQWYYNTDNGGANDVSSGTVFEVSESFPKGFQAFYLMKYEITQGQYVDFLNTLLRYQQIQRVAEDISGDEITNAYVMSSNSSPTYRDTIYTDTGTGFGYDSPLTFYVGAGDRAANYLSWMDIAAYADWAALRPMTELEFEKAARGPIYPVASAYAWGTTSINACTTISGTEDGTEYCSNGVGYQANYGNTYFSGGDSEYGPLRVGIFARANTADRVYAGAGYYGNMELSGNVWEQVVTLGNVAGRGFSGTHGDGRLVYLNGSYDGNATNYDWPGINSFPAYGVSGAVGSGWKGGGSNENSGALQISGRYYAAYGTTARSPYVGGRLARTSSE